MGQAIHFRRCHMCGAINCSQDQRVDRCDRCGKSLAPFYYFDVRFIPVIGDRNLRPGFMENEYQPIQGLAAYWD